MSFLDHRSNYLDVVRSLLFEVVTPVYFVAALPSRISYQVDEVFISKMELVGALEEQQKKNLQLSRFRQKYESLLQENIRMRKLLGSSSSRDEKIQIAEVVSVDLGRGSMKLLINKGLSDGVRVGDAVVDDSGVLGQIVRAGGQTSLVLLVTDKDHAIPIQVRRNGLRAIAGGTGSLDHLVLENLPISSDVSVGDIVETSGLAGLFPDGYPVGRIVDINDEQSSVFASVRVSPLAKISQSKYLLILNKRKQISDLGQKPP